MDKYLSRAVEDWDTLKNCFMIFRSGFKLIFSRCESNIITMSRHDMIVLILN